VPVGSMPVEGMAETMAFDPDRYFFDSMPHVGVLCSADAMSCALCDRVVSFDAWVHHKNEESHQSRIAALKAVMTAERLLHARRKVASSLASRIDSLYSMAWQDALYKTVFDYVIDYSVESTSVTLSIEKYEFMKRVALIELAVWKVSCLLSPPPISVGPFRNVLDCQAWIQ
jgi:hypothetical protein